MDKQRIIFGWGAPPFSEQLPSLPAGEAEAFDADNTAIIRLSVRGVLTESQRDAAIAKCTKKIAKALGAAARAPNLTVVASQEAEHG